MSFTNFNLRQDILKKIEEKGFEEPTPIQKLIIPRLLEGYGHIIGQAPTGTGKTGAFGIPILQAINTHEHHTQALIVAPTRELTVQIAKELDSLKPGKINIVPVYGGVSFGEQLRAMNKGAHIVVATPGRLIDHLEQGTINISFIKSLVLDEADEMLSMGFIADIEKILSYASDDKQVLLFSATMPDDLRRIIDKTIQVYEEVSVEANSLTSENVDQVYYQVYEKDKMELLCRLIDSEPDFYGIVFANTKIIVDLITQFLTDRGYAATGLHGDITQASREKVLAMYKNKQLQVLVATDVAARGIDISKVKKVINYNLPLNPETYVHRIGRTGRAGEKGLAITFVSPQESKHLFSVQLSSNNSIARKQIPMVTDVLESRLESFTHKLLETMEKPPILSDYVAKTKAKLLEQYSSEQLLDAFFENFYGDSYQDKKYKAIQSCSFQSDQVRLFMAFGRSKGYHRESLLQKLVKETGIKQNEVIDLSIFADFSFLTTNFEAGNKVLSFYQALSGERGKQLVTLAKSEAIRKPRNSGRSSRGSYHSRSTSRSSHVHSSPHSQYLGDSRDRWPKNPGSKAGSSARSTRKKFADYGSSSPNSFSAKKNTTKKFKKAKH